MDMKSKIVNLFFVLLALNVFLSADSYRNLRAYKSKNPSQEQQLKGDSIMVRFKDINNFNFQGFEKRYKVKLFVCVAHGVCVFKLSQRENIVEILDTIQRDEKEVESVQAHENYDMKLY